MAYGQEHIEFGIIHRYINLLLVLNNQIMWHLNGCWNMPQWGLGCVFAHTLKYLCYC